MNNKLPPPRANRRAHAKSLEKYQRILDAAAQALCERGYANAKLSDIARAAGTHAGSLYYYFPSREDLLKEVLLTAVERMTNVSLSLDEDAEVSPIDRVSAFVRDLIDQLTAMRSDDYMRAYLRNYNQVPDSIRRDLMDKRTQMRHKLGDLMHDAQAAGEIPESTDIDIATQFIAGATNWLGLWYEPGGPIAREAVADMFLDLMLHGLRGTQGSPAGATGQTG